MKFVYELPMSANHSFRQRILRLWTYALWILIPSSVIIFFVMQLQCNHFRKEASSTELRNETPNQLIQQRNQLQEQLKAVELQPEEEIIARLNEFLENLSRILPEGVQLDELRSDESGVLSVSGEVLDLTSFKILTKPENESFWTFQSSHLTQIRDSLYKFSLECRLLTALPKP